MNKTTIELEDSDCAFVFDATGRLKEIVLPSDESQTVPEIVVKIVELITGNKVKK